jgi:hypothetical protein
MQIDFDVKIIAFHIFITGLRKSNVYQTALNFKATTSIAIKEKGEEIKINYPYN